MGGAAAIGTAAAAASGTEAAARAAINSFRSERCISSPPVRCRDGLDAMAQTAAKKSWRATIFDGGSYVKSRLTSSVRECTPSFA